MTTEEKPEQKPIPWAGVATWPGDMENREILCFGTRIGRELSMTHAYELRDWKPQGLVESLLTGVGPAGRLVALADLTGLLPHATFDLPEGAGIGQAVLAFQKVARGFGSVLERAANAQVSFHLSPRMLDRVWRELGGGGAVWVRHIRPVPGEREMGAEGEAWRKGVKVAYTTTLEDQRGPRHQLFGHRVLDSTLGLCPECGGPMVKIDGKAVCELEALKMEVPPPDEDITQNAGLLSALGAEMSGVDEMSGDLWPDYGVTWDDTV